MKNDLSRSLSAIALGMLLCFSTDGFAITENKQVSTAADEPGILDRLAAAYSDLPPHAERAALTGRQQELKTTRQEASLVVIPVCTPDRTENEVAMRLAKMIEKAQCFKSVSWTPVYPTALPMPKAGANELKMVWNFAREVRDYVRQNPPQADYVLCVDYRFDSRNWEHGFAHFILCDRTGEWVIVDFQNSHHDDYRFIKPSSKPGFEALILRRLEGHLGMFPKTGN